MVLHVLNSFALVLKKYVWKYVEIVHRKRRYGMDLKLVF